jgi:hypothetical protein
VIEKTKALTQWFASLLSDGLGDPTEERRVAYRRVKVTCVTPLGEETASIS